MEKQLDSLIWCQVFCCFFVNFSSALRFQRLCISFSIPFFSPTKNYPLPYTQTALNLNLSVIVPKGASWLLQVPRGGGLFTTVYLPDKLHNTAQLAWGKAGPIDFVISHAFFAIDFFCKACLVKRGLARE